MLALSGTTNNRCISQLLTEKWVVLLFSHLAVPNKLQRDLLPHIVTFLIPALCEPPWIPYTQQFTPCLSRDESSEENKTCGIFLELW